MAASDSSLPTTFSSSEVNPPETLAVPDSNDHGDNGKLKMIVQLVKRSLGVKDLGAMRLSLPASLLEPVPNLEYWSYIDRPDLLAAVNNSEDPLERMLSVIRFTFSKDLKFIKGKVCKPYNSVLGEHFRSYFDVPKNALTFDPNTHEPIMKWCLDADPTAASHITTLAATGVKSPSSASLSVKSLKDGPVISDHHYAESSPNLMRAPSSKVPSAAPSIINADVPEAEHKRLAYLTEQVSHHPPISSWFFQCPDAGVEGSGVDQISARISGTSLKVGPGAMNRGIFIRITSGPGQGEKYRITHPTACVNGILRGSFYATVTDSTIITCEGAKGEQLRAILEYKDEPWLGAPKFLVEGIVHRCPEGSDYDGWTKVRQVPNEYALATFEGCWRKAIRCTKVGSEKSYQLVDLSPLVVVPKVVRPLEEQLPNESRKLWDEVTSNLLKKEFSEATRMKQVIEQKQRDIAAERKRTNQPFVPAYFEADISSGEPALTEEGKRAMAEMFAAV